MALFRSGYNLVDVRVSPDEQLLSVEFFNRLMGPIKTRGKHQPLKEKLTISPATTGTPSSLSYEKTDMNGTKIKHDNNQGAIEGAERMLKTLKRGNRRLPFLRK